MKSALMRLALATAVLVPSNSTAQETAPPPTPQEVLEGLREGVPTICMPSGMR